MSFIERSAAFPAAGASAWPLCAVPVWRGGHPCAMPPAVEDWWHPQAHLALDFKSGRFMRGGVERTENSVFAVTRSSPINLPDAAGIYQALGNNSLPRTDRGLYANGQFTNKITANNLTPGLVTPVGVSAFNALGLTGVSGGHGGGASTGLFGIVDDAAALAAAGLANISNGRAYSISLGGAVGSAFMIFGPALGNTNPHSWGMWARCTGTNATLRMVGGGSYGTVSLEPSANYQFVKFENFTPDATAQFRPQIPFGGTLLIAGMQLLESRFIPDARMATPGAPALLASDMPLVQGVRPSNGQQEPWSGWEAAGFDAAIRALADVRIDRLSANSPRFIAGAGVDANNLWRLIFDTDNRFKFIVRKSGSDVLTLQSGVASSTGLYTVDTRAKPGDYALSATGLPGATSSSSETLPSGVTTLRVGSNFALANPFNGWIEDLQILRAV
jgi:hypothetical protein